MLTLLIAVTMLGSWHPNHSPNEEYIYEMPNNLTCGAVSWQEPGQAGANVPAGWVADVLESGGADETVSQLFIGAGTEEMAKSYVQRKCDNAVMWKNLTRVAWPFHRRAKPAPQPTEAIDPLASPDPDQPCIREYGMFAFEGKDGVTGFSTASCEAAFNDWHQLPSPGLAYVMDRT